MREACHPEQREGSQSLGENGEILRFAQNKNVEGVPSIRRSGARWPRCAIGVLAFFVAVLAGADAQVVQLSFPLRSGQFTNAWTSPITTVFDHAMSFRFESNGVMVAYTGETGTIPDLNEPPVTSGTQVLYSFKKADASPFVINGHYVGTSA